MSGYELENRKVLRRCLKTASDGTAIRQVVPYRGAKSCECATADCGSTNDRYLQSIRAGTTLLEIYTVGVARPSADVYN